MRWPRRWREHAQPSAGGSAGRGGSAGSPRRCLRCASPGRRPADTGGRRGGASRSATAAQLARPLVQRGRGGRGRDRRGAGALADPEGPPRLRSVLPGAGAGADSARRDHRRAHDRRQRHRRAQEGERLPGAARVHQDLRAAPRAEPPRRRRSAPGERRQEEVGGDVLLHGDLSGDRRGRRLLLRLDAQGGPGHQAGLAQRGRRGRRLPQGREAQLPGRPRRQARAAPTTRAEARRPTTPSSTTTRTSGTPPSTPRPATRRWTMA